MKSDQTPAAASVTFELRLRLVLSELTYCLNPPKPVFRRQTCHLYAFDSGPSRSPSLFQPIEADFLVVNRAAVEDALAADEFVIVP